MLANISSRSRFLKLSGGLLNGRSDDGERPPSDFPRLSPAVHCPFQRLIYGPHKCARDAEIAEEVVNTVLRNKTSEEGREEETG